MKGFDDLISTLEEDIIKNYVIASPITCSMRVELIYEMPVSIKRDTLIYNAGFV